MILPAVGKVKNVRGESELSLSLFISLTAEFWSNEVLECWAAEEGDEDEEGAGRACCPA
jgi:hypothetical protein